MAFANKGRTPSVKTSVAGDNASLKQVVSNWQETVSTSEAPSETDVSSAPHCEQTITPVMVRLPPSLQPMTKKIKVKELTPDKQVKPSVPLLALENYRRPVRLRDTDDLSFEDSEEEMLPVTSDDSVSSASTPPKKKGRFSIFGRARSKKEKEQRQKDNHSRFKKVRSKVEKLASFCLIPIGACIILKNALSELF